MSRQKGQMLVTQNKYKREITYCKNNFKESKVNKPTGLDRIKH